MYTCSIFVWYLHMHMCVVYICVCACVCGLCIRACTFGICTCAAVCGIHIHASVCGLVHLPMPPHVEAGDQCWFSLLLSIFLVFFVVVVFSCLLSVSLSLKLTSFAKLACQRILRICSSQPFSAGVTNTHQQEITGALAVVKKRNLCPCHVIIGGHILRYHCFLYDLLIILHQKLLWLLVIQTHSRK